MTLALGTENQISMRDLKADSSGATRALTDKIDNSRHEGGILNDTRAFRSPQLTLVPGLSNGSSLAEMCNIVKRLRNVINRITILFLA